MSKTIESTSFNMYHVYCFIRENPPIPGNETKWFKRVCKICKNDIPSGLLNSIMGTNPKLFNIVTNYMINRRFNEEVL